MNKLEQAARPSLKANAAMQLALEALESYSKSDYIKKQHPKRRANGEKAITALREALAEPKKPEECAKRCPPFQVCDYCQKAEQAEQSQLADASLEPVAWTAASNLVDDGYGHSFSVVSSEPANTTNEPYAPLYAAPVRTKDLTGQDLCDLEIAVGWKGDSYDFDVIAHAVIAKFKEKNK